MAKEIDMNAFIMGDHKEFERIVDMYNRELMYFVNRLIKNEHYAENIVQETFVALYKIHEKFEAAAAINKFLYTTAKNKSLNYLKRENRHSYHQDKIRHQSHDSLEAEALNALISTETMKLLQEEVEKLPPTRRKVFELYQEGKTHAEIAAKLNISTKNVSSQLYYARQALENSFKNGGFF